MHDKHGKGRMAWELCSNYSGCASQPPLPRQRWAAITSLPLPAAVHTLPHRDGEAIRRLIGHTLLDLLGSAKGAPLWQILASAITPAGGWHAQGPGQPAAMVRPPSMPSADQPQQPTATRCSGNRTSLTRVPSRNSRYPLLPSGWLVTVAMCQAPSYSWAARLGSRAALYALVPSAW